MRGLCLFCGPFTNSKNKLLVTRFVPAYKWYAKQHDYQKISTRMMTLTTEFAGAVFRNPFIVAACPSTRDAEHILEAAESGWAGAVTKTVTAHAPFYKNPTPSMAGLKSPKGDYIGFSSNEIFTDIKLLDWCETEIPRIKNQAPKDFVVIASLMEGPEPCHWAESARMLENAGADVLEINVSCPHGMSERYMGHFIQDDPDLLTRVVHACSAAVRIPVIVKLNAQSLDPARLAAACQLGGARGLTASNTLACVISVDIESYRPSPASDGYSTFAGYCGPALRPLALRFVAELARASALPISGVGGVVDWDSAAQFILLGASTVQVGTAVMLEGYGVIDRLVGECRKYLARKRLELKGLRAKSLPYLVSSSEIEALVQSRSAAVDVNRCTLCGICIEPCRVGATKALSIDEARLVVDPQLCTGCGLCVLVCPFDALTVA